MYNICLDTGQDDEWFGHGFDSPEFNEGDEIEFDVSYNGDYANVDVDTVNIINAGSGGGSRRGGSRGNSSRGRGGNSRGGSNNASRRGQSSSNRSKPAPSRKSGGGKGTTDTAMTKEDWAKKDKMIQVQAAQNTAIALVSAAVQADAVKLPAKTADRYDAFCALVDEEAERLHQQYIEAVEEAFAPKPQSRGSSSGRSHDDYDDDVPQ
jgi:hypothetical protein